MNTCGSEVRAGSRRTPLANALRLLLRCLCLLLVADSVARAADLKPVSPRTPSYGPAEFYLASLAPGSGVNSTASGTATLRLSPDGQYAVVTLSINNLTTPVGAKQVR